MPLSPPVGRQHLHTRRVTCQGFFREDGLWDIEGHITDEKSYEHANEWRGPLKPGDFVHSLGDAHLYSNHLEQARLQLTRLTRQLPVMKINPDVKDIFAFRYEDFVLEGYDPHPLIKAQIAV